MSLFRLIFGLVVSISLLGLTSAYADTQSQTTSQTTTSTTPAMTLHKTTRHKTVTRVDLNSANLKTLARVKGIGSKKAKAVVAYRTQSGSFKSVDDLKNVMNAKGKRVFSDKAIAQIKKRVMVSMSQ